MHTRSRRHVLARHTRSAALLCVPAMAVALALLSPVEPSAAEPSAADTDPECGPTVLKDDGTPWICTLAEHFDGDALDRDLWVPQRTDQSGYQHGGVCVVDDEENIEVSDGTLKIHTVKQDEPFTCASPHGDYPAEYTSASLSTFGNFTQAYGRFEFRAKFPDVNVPGLHSALWMWPEDTTKHGLTWPASGEIDVAEVFTQYPDRAIPMLHYDAPMHPGGTSLLTGRTNYWCTLDPSQWTTYVAEWTPEGITISYDGTVCLDHAWDPNPPLSGSAPFDQPFMLALTQVLGEGTNAVTPQTPDLATMEVDSVKVWR